MDNKMHSAFQVKRLLYSDLGGQRPRRPVLQIPPRSAPWLHPPKGLLLQAEERQNSSLRSKWGSSSGLKSRLGLPSSLRILRAV